MSRPTVTRSDLEQVFTPSRIVTLVADRTDRISDPDSRNVLGSLGFPVGEDTWFDLDPHFAERWRPVSEWNFSLADHFEHVPSGSDRWLTLGLIPYDSIAFDPETGQVYCVPQDDDIYVLNSSLRSFIAFLYVLERERPHYDAAMESEAVFEPGAAQERIKAFMLAVDPAALERTQSRWHNVIESVIDPDAFA